MKIDSVNPATGVSLGQIESTDPTLLPALVSQARNAQPGWAEKSLSERESISREFARLLYSRKKAVADLISRENGKPLVESYSTELIPAIDFAHYVARNSKRIFKSRRVNMGIPLLKSKVGWISYEPLGVVGIISPWNYPLVLPVSHIVPALVAGNSVVFKPSEYAVLVGQVVADLLWEAGIPREVFHIVQGAGDVGTALVTSGVDKIFFTGSTFTGKKISAVASRSLTPVSLELGGKDAMIVLEDADIDSATSGAIWGAFMNAGQTCVSVERCFVHERILDEFVTMIQEKIKRLRVGSSSDTPVEIGPIIHRAQFETIKLHVNDAVHRGARIAAGGNFSDRGGVRFAPPTVLTDVPAASLLMNEETFGPVLPIVRFSTEEEAISMANDSRFGLAASVWTSNRTRGLQVARKLRTGAVVINDTISYYGISDGTVGGVKESGFGHLHGKEGMLEMVHAKYYERERAPRMKKRWWYGYDRHTLDFFESAADFLFSRKLGVRIKAVGRLLTTFFRMDKI